MSIPSGLVAHHTIDFLRPQDPNFWKPAFYLWMVLSLAAILAPLVGEIRRDIARRRAAQAPQTSRSAPTPHARRSA